MQERNWKISNYLTSTLAPRTRQTPDQVRSFLMKTWHRILTESSIGQTKNVKTANSSAFGLWTEQYSWKHRLKVDQSKFLKWKTLITFDSPGSIAIESCCTPTWGHGWQIRFGSRNFNLSRLCVSVGLFICSVLFILLFVCVFVCVFLLMKLSYFHLTFNW